MLPGPAKTGPAADKDKDDDKVKVRISRIETRDLIKEGE